MSDIKISALPTTSTVNDADIVVLNQGGITKTATRLNFIKGTLGVKVKVVGVDGDGTIQSCINLCTSASAENPYTVLIPPKASGYSESLVLRGSVSLVGLTAPLNSDAVQITGEHYFAPSSTQANTNRINFQNLTFISSGTNNDTITCSSSTRYFSKLTFSGCIFSGNKADTFSHLTTYNNVAVYVDNCRFESSAGGSASAGITQGNGPLYLSNNTTFDVFGRALDVPFSTTEIKTATSTTGSTTLTVSDVDGIQVGDKISGTGLYSTITVVSVTAPSTVVMSSPPQTATADFTATFGQTPYVEIHDSVLAGKGAEVVRLGNGLLTCKNSNFTNRATLTSSNLAGNGINIRLAGSTVGIVNSSFTISDTNAYTITTEATGPLPANAAYAALNGVSYSNLTNYPFSTKIGANVIVLDYTARATSIENGGTGATTRQAALNALAGNVTANQALVGNGTNITLRALAATDIASGTFSVARGGTGASTLTGIIKGSGTSALSAAAAADIATTLGSQIAAYVYAAPAATAGTPAFRALVAGDLPTVTVLKGGTGASDAPTALVNLGAAKTAEVITLTSTGSWTKPANAKLVKVLLIGGGGGGGGGAKNTGVSLSGGGGGAGGGVFEDTFLASSLTSSVNVTIGAATAGGAGASTIQGGTSASQAGTTIFGSYAQATGGAGGVGGQPASNAAGTGGSYNGNTGGASTVNGAGSTGGQTQVGGPGGGGGGGCNLNGTTQYAGGAGGSGNNGLITGGTAGTSSATAGGAGGAGGWNGLAVRGSSSGGGGGGGCGSTTGGTGSGGNGGQAGPYGSGGGGGGSTLGTGSGGTGGYGSDGIAIITTYF